jgi:hypothetical protein
VKYLYLFKTSKGDENEAAKLAIASMDEKSKILKEYKLQEEKVNVFWLKVLPFKRHMV